jgi:hypothetical protein
MYARGASLNLGGSHAMEYAAVESSVFEAGDAARVVCLL